MPDVAESLNNIADVLQQQGDLPRALPNRLRALTTTDTVLGPRSYPSSRNRETIAATLWAMHRETIAAQAHYDTSGRQNSHWT